MTKILDQYGNAIKLPKRGQLVRSLNTYDAARSGSEYDNYWANADARDADSANSQGVRHRLMHRSRYEKGSSGFYAGILETHVNMLVGCGPKLRMLTTNRNFNQFIERRWGEWADRVQLRRKLWCMAHARTQDGEAWAVLVHNPEVNHDVMLDLKLIEAEQVQSPHLIGNERGYIDGIKFDEFDNIEYYDILPEHPGNSFFWVSQLDPIRVQPNQVLHWFKLERPGTHRGVPALKSTLNLGAQSRRYREANLSTAEKVASFTLFLKTMFDPEVLDEIDPFDQQEIVRGMMTALPNSVEPFQLQAEHPSETYSDFNRSLVSEQARPLSMPYNAAACDSSTYSYASGKLDTLCYRSALNVERCDADDLVLDPLFREWFREFRLLDARFESEAPVHRWDWPAHPIIDAQAESEAADRRLKNGSLSLTNYHSESGMDYEDELITQTREAFGSDDDISIEQMRKINVLRNTSKDAMPFVAELLGVRLTPTEQPQESF